MKKSYHSIELPMSPAAMRLRSDRRSRVGVSCRGVVIAAPVAIAGGAPLTLLGGYGCTALRAIPRGEGLVSPRWHLAVPAGAGGAGPAQAPASRARPSAVPEVQALSTRDGADHPSPQTPMPSASPKGSERGS